MATFTDGTELTPSRGTDAVEAGSPPGSGETDAAGPGGCSDGCDSLYDAEFGTFHRP